MQLETELTAEQKTSGRQEMRTTIADDDVPLIAPGDSSSSIGCSCSSSGSPAMQQPRDDGPP